MNSEVSPLVGPDVDLRGLPFMPLDTVRLLDSDLFALSTGEEFKAALALWCKAWLQVPASSLPDDDRILAHLSSTGSNWKEVRDVALRGFTKCSDGRLYHPVIAEKAREAWQHRQAQRSKAAKRWKAPDPELPGIPPAIPAGYPGEDAAADTTAEAAAYAAAMQGTGRETGTGTEEQKKSERAARVNGHATRALARGTRMTEDWRLPDAWRDWACKVYRIDQQKAVRISLKFRDYYLAAPGDKGVRRDWAASWRSWLSKEFPDA